MSQLHSWTLPALACLLFAVPATAQSDECASATTITGFGTFPYNNTGASTSAGAPCSMGADVWYRWVASQDGLTSVSTCGLAFFDTGLAVYESCSLSSLILCNDDFCGLLSTVNFTAVAGEDYYIRMGGFAGSSGAASVSIGQGTPGGCANPSTGPDVIVGDLTGISNYSVVNGVDAFSVGTTSCNVGDTNLNWFANTNQHPVIGQNMYRMMDGRFEQIGISWLKHGFAALTGNVCCTCSPPGTFSLLGVGCSDPYGSSLNGSQGGLGPRFQVNPFTGSFSYPFVAQNITGNAVFKRLQVKLTDLDAGLNPGAEYFVEGQYITPDDAAAGNHFNNVSYRPCNVAAGIAQVAGVTVREQPAIAAWAAADPNVTLTEVIHPSDGLYIVGSNATDNGDGTWHYEYAVYNMNLQRGIRYFSVPLPLGTTVTNMGFHDVDYHSGEPTQGTDWPVQVAADAITWQTDTFNQNADANAILWGTLYNFRFDADVSPSNVVARVGMFRPGPGPDVPGVPVQGPDPAGLFSVGTPFCDPAVPNSTGLPGRIIAKGSNVVTDNDFLLNAVSLPSTRFGYFLASQASPVISTLPGSQGNLCLDSANMIGFNSLILSSRTNGSMELGVDLSNMPGGIGPVQPGQTWTFTCWYRDANPGLTSNFTDAVTVTFQ